MNKQLRIVCVVLFVLACASSLAAIIGQGGFNRPVTGDAAQYIGVARSLVAGNGYILPRSPWGTSPYLGRLPLWPALCTPAAMLLPHLTDGAILRWMGLLVQAFTAVLLAMLAFRLWPDYRIAALSGAMFALYPPALGLMDYGYSEGSFVLALTAGLLLLLTAGWKQVLGSFVLGLSVLSRSNVIILPFLVAFLAFFWDRSLLRYWKRWVFLTAVFLIPAILWIGRNYLAAADFPLLTSVEGETLYGGNNARVADSLQEWGYWVLPDLVPGETPKLVLAREMTEAQLNDYYRRQGMAFIKQHWFAYPRLLLGKLIRGFVPVPWVPLKSSLVAFFLRFLLYAGAIWALSRHVIQNLYFKIFLGAMFLATLATTIIYYGTYRFTFCLEPYLMVCVAAQLVHTWDAFRERQTVVNRPTGAFVG